jgi:hypothetical protein
MPSALHEAEILVLSLAFSRPLWRALTMFRGDSGEQGATVVEATTPRILYRGEAAELEALGPWGKERCSRLPGGAGRS